MNVPVKYLRECFTYDAESGQLTWNDRPLSHFACEAHQQMWNVSHAGKQAGTPHNRGYLMVQIRFDGKKTGLLAHRIAWTLVHGEWPEMIDHANGDKQDNRISNLRLATPAQNAWNSIKKRGALPVGVRPPSRRNKKFCALITIEGKARTLGSYATAEDAHLAYCAARDKLHGDFSVAKRNT